MSKRQGMKKIIFSEEVRNEKDIAERSVKEISRLLGLKLTYNQYPTISDQKILVWEELEEPWKMNLEGFKRAFLEKYEKDEVV